MKNLRKFVVALAVLLVALLCLTATVSAAEIVDSGKCGKNLTWTLDNEGTLTISGKGEMDDYLKEDYRYAPWADYTILNVVVEKGVTTIGIDAFDFNFDVASVSLPNSLIEIRQNAFRGTSIEKIVIPNSVTIIGDLA